MARRSSAELWRARALPHRIGTSGWTAVAAHRGMAIMMRPGSQVRMAIRAAAVGVLALSGGAELRETAGALRWAVRRGTGPRRLSVGITMPGGRASREIGVAVRPAAPAPRPSA